MDTNRRRLLISLGYGAVSVATLGALGTAGERPPTARTEPGRTPPPGLAANDEIQVAGTTQLPPAPLTPPVLDPSRQADPSTVFDVVFSGGRVMDPATGFDAVMNVGVLGDAVAYIGPESLQGATVYDVPGHVVAPGFIDILSYRPNPFGVWLKVADGVTTNLGMHGINNYANAYFGRFTDAVPVNFGGAFHQQFHRGLLGVPPDREMSAAQLAEFERIADKQLGDGFAGVAFSPEYAPGTSRAEILAIAAHALDQNGVLFFHARYSDNQAPGTNAEAIAEVLDIARATGLAVHVSHLTSTGGTFTMAETLATLEQARAEGIDVTACIYPYDFWATRLGSFRFAGDWQGRYGLDFSDLQIGGTDIRLTSDTFAAAQADNKLVAALGSIPSAEVDLAMQTPWIMVGSDAIAEPDGNNHPRAAGTFARTLGVYVRERGLITLMDALAKITILPARRVERMLPQVARKGRMQIGADADITVFDPTTIADRATVEAPATASVGISHVLVNGVAVMEQGSLRQDRLPGRALRT
ncbi:MAG: amidohydrolase family protein [Acidimicrobiales bacterium]|nr:amidohydrolase family protein [Acidimicrobiales bacterium]